MLLIIVVFRRRTKINLVLNHVLNYFSDVLFSRDKSKNLRHTSRQKSWWNFNMKNIYWFFSRSFKTTLEYDRWTTKKDTTKTKSYHNQISRRRFKSNVNVSTVADWIRQRHSNLCLTNRLDSSHRFHFSKGSDFWNICASYVTDLCNTVSSNSSSLFQTANNTLKISSSETKFVI